MAKYRIKEYDFGHCKSYLLQRHLIFNIWYNPENINAEVTGWYDSIDEAKKSIERKLHRTTSKVVFCTCDKQCVDFDDCDICGNCGDTLPYDYTGTAETN